MKLNWNVVQEKLVHMKECPNYTPKDTLTIDTLYGSMWGLNLRYVTLNEALFKHRDAIIKYSIDRIITLKEYEPIFTKKRKFPRCSIGYGTYGWKYDVKIIKHVIDNHMLIDTAEGYGYGKVETELGKIINGNVDVEIMSKVRHDHMSSSAIFNSINRSVEKLTVNSHFQLHFPNIKYPKAIKDIALMRQQGKTKLIGLSNHSIDMIEMSQNILSDMTGDPISFVQIPFNVIDKRIQDVFIPYCQRQGIYIIAYSPLGQNVKIINTPIIKQIAKKYSATTTQIALAYLLSFPGVIPIPTTNNLNHLKINIEANNLILDEQDIEIIKNN